MSEKPKQQHFNSKLIQKGSGTPINKPAQNIKIDDLQIDITHRNSKPQNSISSSYLKQKEDFLSFQSNHPIKQHNALSPPSEQYFDYQNPQTSTNRQSQSIIEQYIHTRNVSQENVEQLQKRHNSDPFVDLKTQLLNVLSDSRSPQSLEKLEKDVSAKFVRANPQPPTSQEQTNQPSTPQNQLFQNIHNTNFTSQIINLNKQGFSGLSLNSGFFEKDGINSNSNNAINNFTDQPKPINNNFNNNNATSNSNYNNINSYQNNREPLNAKYFDFQNVSPTYESSKSKYKDDNQLNQRLSQLAADPLANLTQYQKILHNYAILTSNLSTSAAANKNSPILDSYKVPVEKQQTSTNPQMVLHDHKPSLSGGGEKLQSEKFIYDQLARQKQQNQHLKLNMENINNTNTLNNNSNSNHSNNIQNFSINVNTNNLTFLKNEIQNRPHTTQASFNSNTNNAPSQTQSPPFEGQVFTFDQFITNNVKSRSTPKNKGQNSVKENNQSKSFFNLPNDSDARRLQEAKEVQKGFLKRKIDGNQPSQKLALLSSQSLTQVPDPVQQIPIVPVSSQNQFTINGENNFDFNELMLTSNIENAHRKDDNHNQHNQRTKNKSDPFHNFHPNILVHTDYDLANNYHNNNNNNNSYPSNLFPETEQKMPFDFIKYKHILSSLYQRTQKMIHNWKTKEELWLTKQQKYQNEIAILEDQVSFLMKFQESELDYR